MSIPKTEKKKAIVVGAGIGGLATALRLQLMGYQVEVFEANAYPGGKLSAFENSGFRFDAGPSLFTMPFLVDELLNEAGESTHFKYKKLDVVCHYFYPDGTKFNAYHDKNKLGEELQKTLGVQPKVVHDYLNYSAFLYEHTAQLFMMRSLHQVKNYFKKDVFKAMFNVHKFGLTESMHAMNQRKIQHPKLVQYFNRFATYNGSNPYEAPAVMNIIPHLEHNQGAFFPLNGMHDITQAVYKAALKHGVKFQFNAKVEEIVVQQNKAVGIKSNENFHVADVVVSNIDIVPTYRKLLATQKAPEQTLKQERSSSALIYYWGIKKEFKELGLHNIFFSNDYQKEFEALFTDKTFANDLTVYINISSKECKTDAPEGCENWFVMVNAPSNVGQNWDELKEKGRRLILEKLSSLLGTAIEPLIVCENVLDPILIEQKTSSYGGALYGAASNNRMAAFLRHPNFSRNIKHLYFVGGSVHPGGGIPLALLSAKITSNLIAERS